MKVKSHSQIHKNLIFSFAALIIVICVSSIMGRYYIPPIKFLKTIFPFLFPAMEVSSEVKAVLLNIRFPRIAAGCLVGSALACAGFSYQNIFRNPMASPDLLGASAGAGLGAALGLLLGLDYLSVSTISFAGGILAVKAAESIGGRAGINEMTLILAGIVIASLCSAGISLIKLTADPQNTLPAITYWLMGSLSSITWKDLLFIAPLIIGGIAVIYALRWKISILSLGSEEAQAIGADTVKLKKIIILAATLITSACVCVSGIIGWIGLLIPHAAAMITGHNGKYAVTAAIILGALFLCAIDLLSRTLSSSEIPVGILTAFIGAPFFLFLLIRERGKL